MDLTLIDARSEQEFRYYVDHLEDDALIKKHKFAGTLDSRRPESIVAHVTMMGWEVLEPLRKSQVVPNRVFVAMSFKDDLDEAYARGIEAAIRGADCEPRMKGMVRSENIINKMLAEIAQAEIVVADATHGSHGAYFEAGYAMALGRKVVFTCREDH